MEGHTSNNRFLSPPAFSYPSCRLALPRPPPLLHAERTCANFNPPSVAALMTIFSSPSYSSAPHLTSSRTRRSVNTPEVTKWNRFNGLLTAASGHRNSHLPVRFVLLEHLRNCFLIKPLPSVPTGYGGGTWVRVPSRLSMRQQNHDFSQPIRTSG